VKLKTAMLALALLASPWQAPAQEAQTLKERLSDKASDDQRVDNCHVPVERRGPKPRPDCPAEARPSPAAAEAGVLAAPKAQ
jgi:hypothetical protein